MVSLSFTYHCTIFSIHRSKCRGNGESSTHTALHSHTSKGGGRHGDMTSQSDFHGNNSVKKPLNVTRVNTDQSHDMKEARKQVSMIWYDYAYLIYTFLNSYIIFNS